MSTVTEPSDYPHQLVITDIDDDDCDCGMDHSDGDVLFGQTERPTHGGPFDPWDAVTTAHNVSVTYRYVPEHDTADEGGS